MLKRSSRRFLSILITCCMVFSSLVIINPSDVRADGEAEVTKLWAKVDEEGRFIPETFQLTDEEPDGNGWFEAGKFINEGTYTIDDEDYSPVILINNASVICEHVDHHQTVMLSGDSSFGNSDFKKNSSSQELPAFEGEVSTEALLAFYNSPVYSDRQIYNYLMTSIDKTSVFGRAVTVYGDADLSASDEGTRKVGSELWGYSINIRGKLHIGSQEGLDDGFNGIVAGEGGMLRFTEGGSTFDDGAIICLEKDARIAGIEKFYKYSEETDELETFTFTMRKHEMLSFEYDANEGKWILCDFDPHGGPEIRDGQYIVDFDDRGGEASVKVGDQDVIPWEPTDFEYTDDPTPAIKPITFDVTVPNGYDPKYIEVSVGVRDDEGEDWYGTWDANDTRIVFNEDHTQITWSPDSNKPAEVHIYWSHYDNIWADDQNGEFIVETKAEANRATITYSPASEDESIEDPNNPGSFRNKLNKSIFENDGTLVFTITPAKGAELHDFEVCDGDTKVHYAKQMNEFAQYTFDECEFLTVNDDGTYTLTLTGDMVTSDRVCVEAWLDKLEPVEGVGFAAPSFAEEHRFRHLPACCHAVSAVQRQTGQHTVGGIVLSFGERIRQIAVFLRLHGIAQMVIGIGQIAIDIHRLRTDLHALQITGDGLLVLLQLKAHVRQFVPKRHIVRLDTDRHLICLFGRRQVLYLIVYVSAYIMHECAPVALFLGQRRQGFVRRFQRLRIARIGPLGVYLGYHRPTLAVLRVIRYPGLAIAQTAVKIFFLIRFFRFLEIIRVIPCPGHRSTQGYI